MTNETTTANDPVRIIHSYVKDAMHASDAAANKAAAVAYAIDLLLGDSDRFGLPVVHKIKWAQSPEAKKNVLAQVLKVCDLDTAAINNAIDKLSPDKAKDVATKMRSQAAVIRTGLGLLGAMAILLDRTGLAAEYTGKGWQVPVQWFVDAKYSVLPGREGNTRMTTFGGPLTAPFTQCYNSASESDDIEIVKYKPHMSVLLANAGMKEKKGTDARPTDAPATAPVEGATPQGVETFKANDFTAARNVLAKEAARDDYHAAPTGAAKTDWQTFFDNCALNASFRAMMAKAIAAANKAENVTTTTTNEKVG